MAILQASVWLQAPASEGLGLMLLRAGWFVYAALDLEYGPGIHKREDRHRPPMCLSYMPSRQYDRLRLSLLTGGRIRNCALVSRAASRLRSCAGGLPPAPERRAAPQVAGEGSPPEAPSCGLRGGARNTTRGGPPERPQEVLVVQGTGEPITTNTKHGSSERATVRQARTIH